MRKNMPWSSSADIFGETEKPIWEEICPKQRSARKVKETCFFTSTFSPTHSSTGQYRVSFFHFEEHFHHQEKRFLICERTCPDLLLQISLVKPKSPYERKYVPSKDLQERKLKWYNNIPKNKESRRTLLDCYLIHYMTLKRSHLQILKPSSMEKVTLGADLYSLWFNRVFVKQK